MSSSTQRALVVLVHGSRKAEWLAPFERLCDDLRARMPGTPVALACLQLCTPDLPDVVERLVAEGVSHVVVAPIFLSLAGHVLRDVPGMLDQARQRCPAVSIDVTGAIGEAVEVQAAMRDALVRMTQG